MEELDNCIKEWLNEVIDCAFNESNSDLLKFWLNGLVNCDNDSGIDNCIGYVEQFGWNNSNVNEYKYFHNETLTDVVMRHLSTIADKFIIAKCIN